MRAIRNNVIIKVEDLENKTKSGIYLPKDDRTLKHTHEGVVVSIGPKVEIDIHEGDRVIMTNNYGHDIKNTATNEHFIVLEDEFILATIKDE